MTEVECESPKVKKERLEALQFGIDLLEKARRDILRERDPFAIQRPGCPSPSY